MLPKNKYSDYPAGKGARNLSKSNLIIFLMVFILGSSNFINGARAESRTVLKLDAARVPWTQLSFHAKNFWIEVSTNVQLKSMPATDIEALLISTPKGTPVRPTAAEVIQMKINTIINPRFRSPVSIYNCIWFGPADAWALGRIRLRRGEDDFKKIYRFTKQGVFRHRIEPKNEKEASLAPEKWTDMNDSFYPYDQARLGCAGVSERSLPIYILSAAATSMLKDAFSICVFGKRQLHRVTLRKEGLSPVRINYIENKQGTTTRKERRINALKIRLESEPMESDLNDDENFSFLGFRDDISIYIDPVTRLPLQTSGIIPTVGKVKLELHKVQLKPH